MRTEKNMQAIDAGCAWRTLQTSPYMYTVILRHIRASLEEKWGVHTLIIRQLRFLTITIYDAVLNTPMKVEI